MCHESFFDFKELLNQMGINNVLKNTEGELVKVTDIKVFRVEKGHVGSFFYKNSYEEEQFSTANFIRDAKKKILIQFN